MQTNSLPQELEVEAAKQLPSFQYNEYSISMQVLVLKKENNIGASQN